MLKQAILEVSRNLQRRKLHTLINVLSLAIGLTISSFAFLYVKQELSYDRMWPEGGRVHRLLLDQRGIPGELDMVHPAVLNSIWAPMADYFATDIEVIARSNVSGVSLVDADTFTNIHFVEPQFLDIFQFEVIEGDMRRTLAGPGFIAMEEHIATELGMSGRVGERVTFKGFNEGEVEYELAAIYRMPAPITPATTVPMFTLMHDHSLPLFRRPGRSVRAPWDLASNVWVKLKPGVSTEAFNAKQAAFVEQEVTLYDAALGPEGRISDHLQLRWQPVAAIHFNPDTRELGPESGDAVRVAAFALVGTLVLLVGCSNSVSLSLAAALERRREIGVRKAAGALPREIMWQQLSESLFRTTLALLPALAAVELLAPVLRAMLPTVSVSPSWSGYALLVAIAALVGVVCGVYPALVLSETRPQLVLRAGSQPGTQSGGRLRVILVAVQFCLASMLIIITAALYLQLAVARATPLGFDPANTILITRNDEEDPLQALRVELDALPNVTQTSFAAGLPPNANLPPEFAGMTLALEETEQTSASGVDAQYMEVGLDFLDFMQMRVIAGRGFDAELDAMNMRTDAAPNVVINMAAARALGLVPEAAVERRVYERVLDRESGEVIRKPLQIVGVVEDNQYLSLRRRPGPVIYLGTTLFEYGLLLRYDAASEATIQQQILDSALRVHGRPPEAIEFLEPQIDAAFLTEQNESRLLLFCGVLALVLASIGLYGLAAFTLEQQVKEVGVRKVLGAEASAIVGLFLWRFARPVMLANVVAWPLAAYFVIQWIERFPYQMERAWLAPLCVATLGLVLAIALLTVGTITARATTGNAVKSLRYE